MGQEISVSHQAVKSKVYRLVDALVESDKSEADVRACMRRWWSLIHPADRPIAQKYLMIVLGKSLVALQTINETLTEIEHDGDAHPESLPKPAVRPQVSAL
jgi:hypothetical protein